MCRETWALGLGYPDFRQDSGTQVYTNRVSACTLADQCSLSIHEAARPLDGYGAAFSSCKHILGEIKP
jgi:hypothetical protein